MELPKNLRILGKKYTVEVRPWHLLQASACGEHAASKQTIGIRDDLPPDLMVETLLHEVIHAADYAGCLKMEESQVSGLSAILYGIFRDNPDFSALLTRGD